PIFTSRNEHSISVYFFFFSSRRRHTRWPRDWSSDVCSSDLASEGRMTIPIADGTPGGVLDIQSHYYEFIPENEIDSPRPTMLAEIGRASCRGKSVDLGGGRRIKKKK